MNDTAPQPQRRQAPRLALVGGLIAVLLVVLAWAVAIDLRSGNTGERQIMAGWHDGLPAGREIAQDTGRPMVVLFTASWCPPCQKLKKNVLHDKAVMAQLTDHYVPVQVDLTDQTQNNPNMPDAQRYGVSGIPTILAMAPDGKVIARYMPADGPSPANFISWLNGIEMNAEPDFSPTTGSH